MSEDNEILNAMAVPQKGRRTQITIETHTTTVISSTGDALQTAYCAICRAVVADLSAVDASAIMGIGESELALFQSTGELHATEAGGLCGKALIDHTRRVIVVDPES